ncbi:hypothetical protein D3C71_1772750 [compost metagenome]
MHREKRRNDAQRLECFDLIQARGLRMYGDRAAISHAIFLFRRTYSVNELIDGGIAVHMRQNLPVIVESLINEAVDLLVGERRVAVILRWLSGWHFVIRFSEPCCFTLRRTVEREFDPSEAEMT